MKRPRKQANGKRRSPREYRVFMSHATADKWIAKVICEKLESVGATAFRDDRDIQAGDNIPDQIRREIKRSHEFLLLLTPASQIRPWVWIELGGAWVSRRSRRIVVVVHQLGFDAIPDISKPTKAVRLDDFDDYLAEVKQRVERK